MDDHLFVNLRTAYSRLVTVREMAISYFACTPPRPPTAPPAASGCCSLHVWTVTRATEDGDVLGVRCLLEQRQV